MRERLRESRPGHGGAAVPPQDLAPAPAVLAPLLAPAGFRLALAAEVRLRWRRRGATLVRVGTWVLYLWPAGFWGGSGACAGGAASRAWSRQATPHGAAAVVDSYTLLDAASHGPGGP